MKIRKLRQIEVSEIGMGCMSSTKNCDKEVFKYEKTGFTFFPRIFVTAHGIHRLQYTE